MTSRELFIKELSLYDRACDGHDEFYAHLPYVKELRPGATGGHFVCTVAILSKPASAR